MHFSKSHFMLLGCLLVFCFGIFGFYSTWEARSSEGNFGSGGTMSIDDNDQEEGKQKESEESGYGTPLKMTILYDNYVFQEGTKPNWGFSCFIEGTEKTILFDTGTQGDILWYNIGKLDVDISKVEQIVLSHNHGDHTGGLASVLEKYHDVDVYFPHSFPESFKKDVEKSGARTVPVNDPVEICKDVYLTGEMGTSIKEQSLIIDTQKGLVVITGCSHQGIVNILKKAKEMLPKDIYLVFGGFHLLRHSEKAAREVVDTVKELGVKYCGATHCTGDEAIAMFQKAFGENYVKMGTGKVIEINE